MEPVDPRDLRISDEDRHRVAEVLRQAAGEGRLELDELEERLEATYAAKTYGDLVPLTLDLPGQHAAPAVRPENAAAYRPERAPAGTLPTWDSSMAIMSETRRAGQWEVGPRHVATAFMGSVVLDLREARFAAREVVIWANAVMGNVQVLVGYGTVVIVDGVGVMGAYQEHRSRYPLRIEQFAPVVRVKGLALMGAVDVRRKESAEEKRRRRELGSGG